MVTKNFGLKSLSSHLRKVRCRLAVFFKMTVVFVSLLENEKVAGDHGSLLCKYDTSGISFVETNDLFKCFLHLNDQLTAK